MTTTHDCQAEALEYATPKDRNGDMTVTVKCGECGRVLDRHTDGVTPDAQSYPGYRGDEMLATDPWASLFAAADAGHITAPF